MICYLSKKIITGIVSSKFCRQCSKAEENGEEPPKHVYPHNCDDLSKAMEVDATPQEPYVRSENPKAGEHPTLNTFSFSCKFRYFLVD